MDKTRENRHYHPCAIYYEQSDSLEYVRQDVPTVYRRIDNILSLILAMDDRSLIGFKIKGFKNFYLHHLELRRKEREDFLELVEILEEALGIIGDRVFDDEKRIAYQRALRIAQADQVEVRDLPKIAMR